MVFKAVGMSSLGTMTAEESAVSVRWGLEEDR